MELRTIPLGPLEANCYVLWTDPEAAVVIDPGAEPERLVTALENEGVRPRLVLNTHGHFDHIGAVSALQSTYGAKHHIHRDDVATMHQVPGGSRIWGIVAPDPPVPDGDVAPGQDFHVGGVDVRAIHTPGHTPGSTCYYVAKEGFVITGDTLFLGSIGRSDFPGGDGPQLLRSIHERLLTLPKATRVLPGHGPASTIEDESESNPFLV